MQTNNINQTTLSDSYSPSFDVDSFYDENGLFKGQKRDKKAHNKKSKVKIEEIKKKKGQGSKDQNRTVQNNHIHFLFKPQKKNVMHHPYSDNDRQQLSESVANSMKMVQYDLLGENDAAHEDDYYNNIMMDADENQKPEKVTFTLSEYEENKKASDNYLIWEKFGLTYEDWENHQEYLDNCFTYEASYDTLSTDEANELKDKIESYEQNIELKEKKEMEMDDANDWWIESRSTETESVSVSSEDTEDTEDTEEDEEDTESFEDYVERMNEEYTENCRQNAIDDNYFD